MLQIRKLADKSSGDRISKFDPDTGRNRLWNPATNQFENWPLSGVQFVGDPPLTMRVPVKNISQGVQEGWIRRANDRPVVRPAGPNQGTFESSMSGSPHVFIHCDEIVFLTVDGPVAYRVTHQPDKYAIEGDDDTPVTPEMYAAGGTRVDWFYDLEMMTKEQFEDSQVAIL